MFPSHPASQAALPKPDIPPIAPASHTAASGKGIAFVVRAPRNPKALLQGDAAFDYLRNHNPWKGTSSDVHPGFAGLDGMAVKVPQDAAGEATVSIVLVIEDDSGKETLWCADAWKDRKLDARRQLRITRFQKLIIASIGVVGPGIPGNPHDGDFYLKVHHENGKSSMIKLFHADWNENYKIEF